MKNLKQNLVKTILCLGVVSVSFMACSSDATDDANIISLDQLNDQLDHLDSLTPDTLVMDVDTIVPEPIDDGADTDDQENVESPTE